MYCSRRIVLAVLIALSVAAGVVQNPEAASPRSSPALSPSQLAKQVRSLIEQKGLRSIRWGVCFARADSGEVLFTYNADDLFVPASNRKLFVSALALQHLGPDYRFRTCLYLSAPSEADREHVHGDLIVRGVGDPTFLNPNFNNGSQTATLRRWADVLCERGVRFVHGDIVMDDSGFESGGRPAQGWIKDYETAQYAPRASGICFGGNCIAIAVRPAKQVGQPAIVTVYPENSIVKVDNGTKTGRRGSPDTIKIERADDGPDHFVVRGNLACGARQQAQRIPAERPGLIAGDVFRRILEKRGISVRGKVRTGKTDSATTRTDRVVLAEYRSPPLRDILAVVNKDSDNHCAEQLFQAVAFAVRGRTSYREAKRLEESFLARIGILPDAANFEDGSGLSRMNLISPRATAKMLGHMFRHPQKDEFIGSLAVAGKDGTLANRMGRRTIGRVFAKTGALSMACCLAGYAKSRSGSLIVFAIFANQTDGRTGDVCYVQDKVCDWLVRTNF